MMSDDLVTQMRERCNLWSGGETRRLMIEAADEIERLQRAANKIINTICDFGFEPLRHEELMSRQEAESPILWANIRELVGDGWNEYEKARLQCLKDTDNG
jgi:hypothetical protein